MSVLLCGEPEGRRKDQRRRRLVLWSRPEQAHYRDGGVFNMNAPPSTSSISLYLSLRVVSMTDTRMICAIRLAGDGYLYVSPPAVSCADGVAAGAGAAG